jgi:transposase
MTKDEELEQLRAENTALCEAVRSKDEELEQAHQANQDLREGLTQAIRAIGSQQEQVKVLEGLIDALQERIKTLERQRAKDSHNSSLPPSSDRFVRPPKSLRKKSGKKAGGQPGHRGHHLRQMKMPDEILVHPVIECSHCHHELRTQKASVPYARAIQVLQELLGIQLSAGSIASFVNCCHLQLAEMETQLKAALVKANVIQQDERAAALDES